MRGSLRFSTIILVPFILVGVFAGVLFFVRSGPRSVAVTVEDAASGRPLTGITVVAEGEMSRVQPSWAETNEAGVAHFDDLEEGLVTFRVSIPEYRDFYQTVTVKRGQNDVVEFLLETETAELRGRLLNAQTGMPVAEAVVLVGGVRAETDEEGRFHLDEVIIGAQTLKAEKAGFEELSTKVRLDRGMVKNVGNLFLKPEI